MSAYRVDLIVGSANQVRHLQVVKQAETASAAGHDAETEYLAAGWDEAVATNIQQLGFRHQLGCRRSVAA